MPRFFPFVAILLLALTQDRVAADASPVPGQGFEANHYQALWAKSPFAVASAEAGDQPSNFSLVGVGQFDGVSYACLVDHQNQDQHFVVSTASPVKNLTLLSITKGADATATYANLQKGGENLTLKLEVPPSTIAQATIPTIPLPVLVPGAMPPPIAMPQQPMTNQQQIQQQIQQQQAMANGQPGGNGQGNHFRPRVFNRGRIIQVPPPPPRPNP